MSSLERLIVQNINRNKLNEGLHNCGDTSECRMTDDLIEVYDLMLSKGYNEFPEDTCEKRGFREIESKLIELNVGGISKQPEVKKDPMVGEFLTSQEDTIKPNK